jgi:hypothetical protein
VATPKKKWTPAARAAFAKKMAAARAAKGGKKKTRHAKRTKSAKKRRNPESSAVAAYIDTHGKPPGKTVTVDTPKKYHSVLAGMGKLESIIFAGGPVKSIDFGKGTYLAMNERRTQLFIVGGDQSVCLKDFGISPVHETEVLGEVREVVYFTEKTHLIEKDGGKGPYGHKFKSPLPVLVYDTRNKLLSFAGGGYTIPSEGITG